MTAQVLTKSATKRKMVEINMAILNAMTPNGYSWTIREISDITGCSRGLVSMIEKKALEKLSTNEELRQYAS